MAAYLKKPFCHNPLVARKPLIRVPVAPVLIGLILGPMAETQMRRALSISQGDPTTLVSTPISATLLAVSLLVLVLPAILRRFSPKLAPL
jgi:putative tricarboxylic transport membrane protein